MASASPDGVPYLVPLSFDWDGEALLIATPANSPTGRNLATTRTVRLGLGHTRDVSMIEGEVEVLEIDALPQERGDQFAARAGFDPRALATPYRWFRITPAPHPGLARGQRVGRPRADARRPLVGLTPDGNHERTRIDTRWRHDEHGHEARTRSRLRLHAADSHDLIRVHGARVNNLKDVSVEIPKRRLTVFTGVSGSGKSSLVFGTIAAESQRLINETYSAFVQGFMPTLARPEVDVLDGLTTAIIVDQQRMGADPRSTVGTATDANAMLRILFSRLGQPHIGSPSAFSFNVPSVRASGGITVERGNKTKTEKATFTRTGGMCPRCEGRGTVTDIDLSQLYDDSKSLTEGALTIPGYKQDGWNVPDLRASSGFFDPDKPIRKFTKKELHDLLYQEPTKIKVERHQPHLRGADPEDPEVDPLQGPRGDAAAHPRLRGAGGHLHHLPRVRRHPAQRGGPVVEDRGDQHRRRLRDADQRPGRMGPRPRRAVGRAAARGAAADPRLVRGDRARLPLARPAVGHAVGRRGAAHQDDPPPRLLAHRRHLRLRRAHHRACTPTTSSG